MVRNKNNDRYFRMDAVIGVLRIVMHVRIVYFIILGPKRVMGFSHNNNNIIPSVQTHVRYNYYTCCRRDLLGTNLFFIKLHCAALILRYKVVNDRENNGRNIRRIVKSYYDYFADQMSPNNIITLSIALKKKKKKCVFSPFLVNVVFLTNKSSSVFWVYRSKKSYSPH